MLGRDVDLGRWIYFGCNNNRGSPWSWLHMCGLSFVISSLWTIGSKTDSTTLAYGLTGSSAGGLDRPVAAEGLENLVIGSRTDSTIFVRG